MKINEMELLIEYRFLLDSLNIKLDNIEELNEGLIKRAVEGYYSKILDLDLVFSVADSLLTKLDKAKKLIIANMDYWNRLEKEESHLEYDADSLEGLIHLVDCSSTLGYAICSNLFKRKTNIVNIDNKNRSLDLIIDNKLYFRIIVDREYNIDIYDKNSKLAARLCYNQKLDYYEVETKKRNTIIDYALINSLEADDFIRGLELEFDDDDYYENEIDEEEDYDIVLDEGLDKEMDELEEEYDDEDSSSLTSGYIITRSYYKDYIDDELVFDKSKALGEIELNYSISNIKLFEEMSLDSLIFIISLVLAIKLGRYFERQGLEGLVKLSSPEPTKIERLLFKQDK